MPANQWVRGANGSLFMLDESVSAPCSPAVVSQIARHAQKQPTTTSSEQQPSTQQHDSGCGRSTIGSLQARLDELDLLMRTSRVDNKMGQRRFNAPADPPPPAMLEAELRPRNLDESDIFPDHYHGFPGWRVVRRAEVHHEQPKEPCWQELRKTKASLPLRARAEHKKENLSQQSTVFSPRVTGMHLRTPSWDKKRASAAEVRFQRAAATSGTDDVLQQLLRRAAAAAHKPPLRVLTN